MAKGDHIYVRSTAGPVVYQHHGIDIGDGTVIHLAASAGERISIVDKSAKFAVRRESMEEFAQGKTINVVHHQDRLSPETTVAIAQSLVGRQGYHLLDGNCEHFATLCATGKAKSRQVEFGQSALATLASVAVKTAWAASTMIGVRTLGARVTSRLAMKLHPLSLAADGVELLMIASSCAVGLPDATGKRLARASGDLTALGIGCVVAGPVGGLTWLAIHRSSTAIADRMCQKVRMSL